MVDYLTIILSGLISAAIAIIGILFEHFVSIERRLSKMRERLARLEEADKWVKDSIKYFRKFIPPAKTNPSRSRRDILLDEMEAGTLSPSDAKELRDILEREAEVLRAAGNIAGALALFFLILLIGYAISSG